MSNISITFTLDTAQLERPLRLVVFVKNAGTSPFEGGVVSTAANNYCNACSAKVGYIYPGGEAAVRLEVPVFKLLSMQNLPSSLSVKVVNLAGVVCKDGTLSVNFGKYAGDIPYYLSPTGAPLKLVCFGIQGACKSSFINSIYKMLQMNVSFSVANEGAHYGATTVQIAMYKAKAWGNFCLVDTWGETLANYRRQEFLTIIGGSMPIGYHMIQGEVGPRGDILGVPDCVLFFTTVQAVEEPEWTSKLAKHIEEVTARGIPFVVLLTKVDDIDPSLGTDPDAKSATLDSYKQRLAKEIGMASYKIDHIVNYHFKPGEEAQLRFAIDRHAFLVLRKALDSALQHARSAKSPSNKCIEF